MALQTTIRYKGKTFGNRYPSDTFSVRISSPPRADGSLYLSFKPENMNMGRGENLETSGIVESSEISLSVREARAIAEKILQQTDNLGGEPVMLRFTKTEA